VGVDFEATSFRLRPRPANEGNGPQRDAHGVNGCFSHAEIVTEMENQKAEVTHLVT
jgi:hypothetical protein